MRRRDQVLQREASRGRVGAHMYILPYDTSRLSIILSAERIAKSLLRDFTSFVVQKRKPLRYYNKYLIYGAISADIYVLLVVMPADGGNMDFQTGGQIVAVPRSLVVVPRHPTNTEAVEYELLVQVYSRTGCVHYGKYARIMHALLG